MKQNKINLISIYWILSAIFICIISNTLFTDGPEFTLAPIYIVASSIYLVSCFMLNKFFPIKETNIPAPYFSIGAIILIFAPPLFENDHYRYIWEAKIILNGENPYITAPSSMLLEYIKFEKRELIGFPQLTTIYPPLALIWFSIGAFFSFAGAMITLKLMNSIIVFYFFKLLSSYKVNTLHLILIFPFLQKEFISSIHIDLFASSFLFFSFWAFTRSKTNSTNPIFLNLFSFWTKYLSLLSIPFFFLAQNKEQRYKKTTLLAILSIPIGLILFFYLFVKDFDLLLGVKAFTANWFWHSGFFTLLIDFFEIDHKLSRSITGICFLVFYLIVFFMFLRRPQQNRKPLLASVFLLIFSALVFFSPVFNPWYAIWFLPFALIQKNIWGVIYVATSYLAYAAYGMIEYIHYTQFLSHMVFIPLVIKEYKFINKRNLY